PLAAPRRDRDLRAAPPGKPDPLRADPPRSRGPTVHAHQVPFDDRRAGRPGHAPPRRATAHQVRAAYPLGEPGRASGAGERSQGADEPRRSTAAPLGLSAALLSTSAAPPRGPARTHGPR